MDTGFSSSSKPQMSPVRVSKKAPVYGWRWSNFPTVAWAMTGGGVTAGFSRLPAKAKAMIVRTTLVYQSSGPSIFD
jgi:hypothetical protein